MGWTQVTDSDDLDAVEGEVVEDDPSDPTAGAREIERLVRLAREDPSGKAVYEAIRGLDLSHAHAYLLMAVVGLARTGG
jgi:hypothetical protein